MRLHSYNPFALSRYKDTAECLKELAV